MMGATPRRSRVLPRKYLGEAIQLAKKKNLAIHLDGPDASTRTLHRSLDAAALSGSGGSPGFDRQAIVELCHESTRAPI